MRGGLLALPLLAAALALLPAADAIAHGSAHRTLLAAEERCPRACSRNGLCTRDGCQCYLGYGGDDCADRRADAISAAPAIEPGSHFGRPRTVCVAMAQVPHSHLSDGIDLVAWDAYALATDLASRGDVVTLVLVIHDGPHPITRTWAKEAMRAHNIRLHVLYRTQHYYMPNRLAHAFELYAWMRDRVRVVSRSLDAVSLAPRFQCA